MRRDLRGILACVVVASAVHQLDIGSTSTLYLRAVKVDRNTPTPAPFFLVLRPDLAPGGSPLARAEKWLKKMACDKVDRIERELVSI